jgi:Na+-transporting NADH:ubiquinone oxidoreductase subunit F
MMELAFGLIIISGIGTLLAFLLEIAGSYLADYGEKHILINDIKEVIVDGGRPLLTSLMEEKIYIPSACGGKGTCSYCKVKVHEGGGPVLPTETPYLSPEEVKENVRLSCQVKVKDNLKIEIPEELFLVKEFRVQATKIEALTPDIKETSFKIISPQEGITFRPGQYIQLEVPKYKLTKKPEYRAYSISSSSGQPHNIDLVITKAPGGEVSTYVHDYLRTGEELVAQGPYGDFFLRESENNILLVATGSGLAPIKSILHQIENSPVKRKTSLFFGAKTRDYLYYYEELKSLERKMDNFTFVPTLSRPREEDQWQGERGRVTALIEKYIPDHTAIDAYLCGAPEMVESCIKLLKEKGISEACIFSDMFE